MKNVIEVVSCSRCTILAKAETLVQLNEKVLCPSCLHDSLEMATPIEYYLYLEKNSNKSYE